DPACWEDYLWMKKESSKGGVFHEMAEVHQESIPEHAIRNFHAYREQKTSSEQVMEAFAWKLFRRYVLATVLFLVVFVSGIRLTSSMGEAELNEHLTEYLGWQEFEQVEPEYWLFQD
ncbi:hypothetical protein QLX67_09350, partial [Balneolaceae bacterium ANBcel3]|nr:hypothetical protein [Balneolaceae bacterium ANBcel3]